VALKEDLLSKVTLQNDHYFLRKRRRPTCPTWPTYLTLSNFAVFCYENLLKKLKNKKFLIEFYQIVLYIFV